MEAATRVRRSKPQGGEKTDHLLGNSLVWDMTLPGMFSGLNEVGTLDRYRAAGFGFVSITVGNDSVWDPRVILERLATIRADIGIRRDRFQIVRTGSDILQARCDGKLAVSFHLQGTNG